jgi:hypothetical protein
MMTLNLENRMLRLPVPWLRTASCLSFICLFMVIFALATVLVRIAGALQHFLELGALEVGLLNGLTRRRPGHAAT